MKRPALLVVAALLALNAVLLLVQPGLALSTSFWDRFLGPGLVRAEIVVKRFDGMHDFRLDRGRIRAVSTTSITLYEKDGTTVTVPLAPDVDVVLNGRHVGVAALRRRMIAITIRDRDGPAQQVIATT